MLRQLIVAYYHSVSRERLQGLVRISILAPRIERGREVFFLVLGDYFGGAVGGGLS